MFISNRRKYLYVRKLSDLGVVKSRAAAKVPLQAWAGPEDSGRMRLPDFNTFGT